MSDRTDGSMRIQRALARAGVASRRHAETLVSAGRVTVNGAPATIGQSVDPRRDRVAVDGTPVDLSAVSEGAGTWVVLNKPAGFVTTRTDPEGRRTVFELAPDVPGLTYVGRLDYLTEGLLLLTTDGEAAHRLTHPSAQVERTYVATVRGNAGAAAGRLAREGVELEDGLVLPSEVEARPLGHGHWELELTIAEGRNREVRRICDALGLEVHKLVRTRFGPVRLGALASGTTRGLTTRERDLLAALVRETDVHGAAHEAARREARTPVPAPTPAPGRGGRGDAAKPARPRDRDRGHAPARPGGRSVVRSERGERGADRTRPSAGARGGAGRPGGAKGRDGQRRGRPRT